MNIFLRLSLFLSGSERTRKKERTYHAQLKERITQTFFCTIPTFHVGALSFHTKYFFRNQCAIAPVAWMAANPVSTFRKKLDMRCMYHRPCIIFHLQPPPPQAAAIVPLPPFPFSFNGRSRVKRGRRHKKYSSPTHR